MADTLTGILESLIRDVSGLLRRVGALEARDKPLSFVPQPTVLTSTSWDGDAKSGASGTIDLSAVFAVPAGAKAVSVLFQMVDATPGTVVALGAAVNQYAVTVRTQVANVYNDNAGTVPCDANGDIYFYQSADVDGVNITITGYWTG